MAQFCPKCDPIPDQLLFYRLCLTPVALPFSCRGGGRAERVKFAVPHRGAGVLNPVRTPYRSPGELASPYLSAGPAETVVPNHGRPVSLFFRFFFGFFGARKNGQKTDGQKIDLFRKFWRFWRLRRRFSTILAPKTGLLRRRSSVFFSGRCFA